MGEHGVLFQKAPYALDRQKQIMGHGPSLRSSKTADRDGAANRLEPSACRRCASDKSFLRTLPPPTRYDVSVMPAPLLVKQQCFGDPASTPQGVKLGNPRNMPDAAANGREAQRAAADQFAANALPVIESVRAAGTTSFLITHDPPPV
jgi:hypothetical protein